MYGIKDIVKALNVLKSVPEADMDKILKEVGKASPGVAEELTAEEMVHDFRTQGEVDTPPSKKEIPMGPSEESSGAGAERMIERYSRPAPQDGVALTAEKFERMLSPLASSMKAMADAIKSMNDRAVAKAEPDEDEEEESEVTKTNAARCKALIKKAREDLAAAKAMEDEADDEDEEMKARKGRKAGRALRKSAAKTLARARTRAYAAKSAELKVEIRTLIAKADVEVMQDDEDEDEDEAEKAKAVAAKAEAMARNQADRANKDGNQEDAAKSAASLSEDHIRSVFEKAFENSSISTMVSKTIPELMDVMMGRSRGAQAPQVFDLAKAKPDFVIAKGAALPAAVEAGKLSEHDAGQVRQILNMHKNAQEGNLGMEFVKATVERSPQAVRDFLAADIAA